MKLIDSEHIVDQKALVATIGFFDGVHTGHQYLIEQLKAIAQERSLSSAVITFPVHPRQVLHSDYQPALICGYDEKLRRLSKTGIDCCVSLDFSLQMSRLSAKDFIQQILKQRLNVSTLVIGYDHRFGHNRADGFEQYKEYGREVGIDVIQSKELPTGDHVSSSRIRRVLGEGDIRKANLLLGYNYTISGKIVEGFKVGRTIGFPTANIKIWENFKVIPPYGVYAVYVLIDDIRYKGMLYIGKRPTLQNSNEISLEVNIFDFDDDLYGKTLTAEFIDFIRPDQKFANIEILKKQILEDKMAVIRVLTKQDK